MRKFHWGEDEQQRFEEGLKMYGRKHMKMVAKYVGTRTLTQVHSHA